MDQALEKACMWETANLQASDMTDGHIDRKDESNINTVRQRNKSKKTVVGEWDI